MSPPVAEEPARVVPLTPPRSTVLDATLRQAWVCYGRGNLAGARQLALVSLEATRNGEATPEQVAQATALLELCKQKEAPPQRAEPPPEPQAPPRPTASLPQPEYPLAASGRHSSGQLVMVSWAPQPPMMPGPMSFGPDPWNGPGPMYMPAGGPGPIPYPAGRGPGVCPNYAVQDDCLCHQWESSVTRMRRGESRLRAPQAESNIARMRHAESLLGQP